MNLPILYHLSFSPVMGGLVKPRAPTGYTGNGGLFGEPDVPRVCFSDIIEGCFYAVYPNISHLFEKKKYPYIDMFLYTADTSGLKDHDVMLPAMLTEKRFVHDAHETREYWVLKPVVLTLSKKLRFYNTSSGKDSVSYFPFDNKKEKLRFLSPYVKYVVLNDYASPASVIW